MKLRLKVESEMRDAMTRRGYSPEDFFIFSMAGQVVEVIFCHDQNGNRVGRSLLHPETGLSMMPWMFSDFDDKIYMEKKQ